MNAQKLKRAILRVIILLLLYVLQTDVFNHLRISGICPLALPLAAVGFGIFDGGLKGGLWGLAAGILCDLSAGSSFAFTILLTLIGFFSGFLSEFFLARGFPSFLTLSLGALLLCAFIQAMPAVAYLGMSISGAVRSVLIQTVYSLIFVLPVYWASRGISRLKGR